ncbi:MAG TPA: hypothetical protein VMV34_07435 [Terriglobia bacterium]|nr:hypothetical protein [Terriglobia bacterium]
MTRRVYLYFMLTFLLGIVVGGVGLYTYGWYTGQWRPKFNRQHVIEVLQRKLGLSSTQTAQLKQIVDEMQSKQGAVRQQVEPQFQAIREEARSRTRVILNPEQLQKFNEMVKRWDEWRKKHPHRLR